MRDLRTWLSRGLDSVLRTVAPQWALRRQRARHALEMQERVHRRVVERYFDGDDGGRLRGDRWMKSQLSPDSALEEDLLTVRRNVNELYRKFPYITGAIEHRTDNVIGTGVRPQARIQPLAGVVTAEQATLLNERLEELWRRWEPQAGRGGRQSFHQIIRLGHRCWRRDGDVLLVHSDVPRPGKPIPLQLDLIDAERIESPHTADQRVRLGVQKTERGEIEGYWVRRSHPHDTLAADQRHDFVAADRAFLLYEELWPDQSRGLPWAFSILSACRDFEDYTEAVLIAAQVAACQSVHVSTSNPDLLARAGLNGRGELEMQPGQIVYHDLETQVQQITPQYPSTTFGMFAEWQLLKLAAGLNYPFGWLIKDRRHSSYSAGRLEEIDGGIPLRTDFAIMRSLWLVPTWERFVRECVLAGLVEIDPVQFDRNPWAFTAVAWLPPARQWVDPEAEVQAAILAKDHNLGTLSDVLAHRGRDLEETLALRARERELERIYDVLPPGAPRASSPAGASPAANDD